MALGGCSMGWVDLSVGDLLRRVYGADCSMGWVVLRGGSRLRLDE